MTDIPWVKTSGRLMYEVIAGSRMYGTDTPDSDTDTRGLYVLPSDDLICISKLSPAMEIANDSQDIKYFELKKFIDLAMECNPNIMELLWPPDDCVTHMTPLMQKLIENRRMFVSKKAAMSFVGYARDQVAKARGQNKMVNNPQPEKKPEKEDFCWVIPRTELAGSTDLSGVDTFPFRPVPLAEVKSSPVGFPAEPVKLSRCHVASVEHIANMFRLYDYGLLPEDAPKGVFSGLPRILIFFVSLQTFLWPSAAYSSSTIAWYIPVTRGSSPSLNTSLVLTVICSL